MEIEALPQLSAGIVADEIGIFDGGFDAVEMTLKLGVTGKNVVVPAADVDCNGSPPRVLEFRYS